MKIAALSLIFLGVCALSFPGRALAQPQAASPKPTAVYLAAYRTPRHMRYSKPEVFHRVVAGVVEYLQTHQVIIAQDPLRKRIESGDFIPVPTLTHLAREAGASSLLLVTVDRPLTKWIKVQVEAYDLSGKLLWKEAAEHGGGFSGKGGEAKALAKLEKRLKPRLGQPGLDQEPASEKKAAAAPAGR